MRVIVNKIVESLRNGSDFLQIMNEGKPKKLEDRLREVLRRKHYSLKTEESYVGWYKRYVLWHGKRHPAEMGAREVEAFLTGLAVEREVAAPTQNQALNALVFFYTEVLEMELVGIEALRAKRTSRLPVVLTKEEVGQLLRGVTGEAGLAVETYGQVMMI